MNLLVEINNSEQGDFYENQYRLTTVFAVTKESSVIVLGKDSGPDLEELVQVRDYLLGKGYRAQLIRDVPEINEMSNEEKVRLWTVASRFCVMVDRAPAGHIAEYMMLRGQRSILALLRPFQFRSTYMIGDDTLIDVNHIRLFEFEQTPISVLDDVIAWAESIVKERAMAYERFYPWRHEQA